MSQLKTKEQIWQEWGEKDLGYTQMAMGAMEEYLQQFKDKNEVKNVSSNSCVSGSVAFAKWIGERMNKNSWFKYDARFGKWYVHMKGHLTTEELYGLWLTTDR